MGGAVNKFRELLLSLAFVTLIGLAMAFLILLTQGCGGAVEETPQEVCSPGHVLGVGLGPGEACCVEPDAGVTMVGSCVANGGA